MAPETAIADARISPLVAARGLTLRLGGRTILNGVDLAVAAGEIVTVIGPNGGGKTSLVRALLGLLPLDAGTVERRPGLSVGYVPQKLGIDWTLPLTVRRLMTLTRRAGEADILAALGETGAAHLAGAAATTLSGGELQRVALARALLGAPELLVLDEPVQGVDFAGEVALYELITAIRDRHRCGIVLVSHDLHVVMRATDHVICLNGHVCCAGEPEVVSRDAEYLRLFGPRAAGAIAFYSHHHDHSHGTGGGGEPVDDDHHHHHHDHAR